MCPAMLDYAQLNTMFSKGLGNIIMLGNRGRGTLYFYYADVLSM